MVAVTNHSTLIDIYAVNAACLYEHLRPRWHVGGVRRRVIVTSPPYGLLRPCDKFSPRFGKLVVSSAGNLSVITGRHFRAAWLDILSSFYLRLNNFANNKDLAVIVLKNFKNNNVERRTGRNLVEETVELVEYVGFKHVETLKFRLSNGSHFVRYHDIKGHKHDLPPLIRQRWCR